MFLSALPEQELEEQVKPDKVLVWRTEFLVKAGYDAEAAKMLAESKEVDLHSAEALLRNGCSATLALLILL